MREHTDIAIVGAGASGLAAAIAAKRVAPQARVLLLEQRQRAGQKLLATGAGRCNLSNRDLRLCHYNEAAKPFAPLFARFGSAADYFAGLGLLVREEEGRIYPYSLQAASVLEALRGGCERLGAQLRCGFSAAGIRRSGALWELFSESGETVLAGRVVLAAGSPAGQGSDNAPLLAALDALGVPRVPFSPALSGLCCADRRLTALRGLRIRAAVSLFVDGRRIARREGEVQFGRDYLGGICVMDLVRAAGGVRMADGALSLDLMPEFSAEAVFSLLQGSRARLGESPAAALFGGALPKMVGNELLKGAVRDAFRRSCSSVSDAELRAAAQLAKDWRFAVSHPQPLAQAQAAFGGLQGADPETLELPGAAGLFGCGELLDVCGDCGGYNLHWAWVSGSAAGAAAAKSLLREDVR